VETIVISFGTAIIVAVLTSWLSYARSSKEKLWDLRREAYGTILSAWATAERICDSADEFIGERGEIEYFESTYSKSHDAEIGKQMTIANKRFSDDYLILSDEFIAIYEHFESEAYADNPNDMPPDEHDRFASAIRKNRPLLLGCARAEMTVKGWRGRPAKFWK
jgi:hypothetical protein